PSSSSSLHTFAGPAVPPPLAQALAAGRPVCAHNADNFDALVWRARGLPEPSTWIDTLPLARSAGLPGSLDGIGAWLFGVGKDPAGRRLIDRFCKPYGRRGLFREPTITDYISLARYCIVDALLLAKAFPQLTGHAEEAVVALDRTINCRGLCLDRN